MPRPLLGDTIATTKYAPAATFGIVTGWLKAPKPFVVAAGSDCSWEQDGVHVQKLRAACSLGAKLLPDTVAADPEGPLGGLTLRVPRTKNGVKASPPLVAPTATMKYAPPIAFAGIAIGLLKAPEPFAFAVPSVVN
jgi:hypothetical protein